MDFKEFLYKKMNTSLYGEWESNFSSDISLFSHQKGNAQLSIIGDQEEFMKSLFVKGIDKLNVSIKDKKLIATNGVNLIFENG